MLVIKQFLELLLLYASTFSKVPPPPTYVLISS